MEIKDELIKLLDKKQVDDIVTIDFTGKSPFLDYFLIGTVRNGRMANAVVQSVDDYCSINGIKVNHIDKAFDSNWYLIDIGSIVIHIFFDGDRQKYDIEGLWKDLILK